jgi:osmotically-inducible protein OsmY
MMNSDYQYLVGKLQHALATDSRVNMLDIKVMVRSGKIHLIGQVATEERRRAVARVVADLLPGVEVRNELTVLEVKPPPQPEIIHD